MNIILKLLLINHRYTYSNASLQHSTEKLPLAVDSDTIESHNWSHAENKCLQSGQPYVCYLHWTPPLKVQGCCGKVGGKIIRSRERVDNSNEIIFKTQ